MAEQKVTYKRAGEIMAEKYPRAKQQTGPDGDRWIVDGANVGSYDHGSGTLRINNSFTNGRIKAQQEIRNKFPVLNAQENYTGISKMEDGFYAIPKTGNRKGPFKTKGEAAAFIASEK